MSYIGGILPDININSVNHKSEEEIFNFSNNNIKTLLFWYLKTLHLFVLLKFMLFKKNYLSL